jgi:hypothetical protein
MRAYLFISFWFATLCMAGSPAVIEDLTKLGQQLRHLRSLPVGAPTSARCPENLSRFSGLEKKQITDALGAPDYTEDGSVNASRRVEWSYFFTSPVPEGQVGGGFPELTFIFGRNGRVMRTTCYYSR